MKDQRKHMATVVERLLEQRGWSQERLAREAGVSTKTINRVVHADGDRRAETVRAIAEALKVPESTLRGEPETPVLDKSDSQLDRIEATLDALSEMLVRIEASQELREIHEAVSRIEEIVAHEAPDDGPPPGDDEEQDDEGRKAA